MRASASGTTKMFLAGDVMTGRGIDQILPHPGNPEIFERYAKSALDYVRLAERRHGPIPTSVAFEYVWGDALAELKQRGPDFELINLETAITCADTWELKGINYRMNPENVGVLEAACIRACSLANNHILDWGPEGLMETLRSLRKSGIATVGAGRTRREASAPLVFDIPRKGRVAVLAFGSSTSGVPRSWNAQDNAPGINLLPDDPDLTVAQCRKLLEAFTAPGDIVVASIHWGGNWGYHVPRWQRNLAHRLIRDANVDIVHGHSSHHPKAIEVYRDKLILYGCGDLINDYEGIRGYDEFRGDLTLTYFAVVATADGRLQQLDMVPYRVRAMRLERAGVDDAAWLANTFNRETVTPHTGVELGPDATLCLRWT